MNILAWVNVVAYVAVAIVGAIGNSTFLFTLCVSKTIRTTLGSSAILLGALAINDLFTNILVIPIRVWNMAVGSDGVYFADNSVLCAISSRAFYAFPQTSMWLLCTLAGCRACAVYAPHFYKRKVRVVAVQLMLAIAAVFLGWFSTVLGVVLHWFSNIPLSYTDGTCEAVPISTTYRDQAVYALYVQLEFWKGFWIPLPLGFVFYALVYIRLIWKQRIRIATVAAAEARIRVGSKSIAPAAVQFCAQKNSPGNTKSHTTTKLSPVATQMDADCTLPGSVEQQAAAQPVRARLSLPINPYEDSSATSVATPVANAVVALDEKPRPSVLHASARRTLAKLRLLVINHVVHGLLVLPGGLAYATQAYMTTWGASVPWLWAVLNILGLCSLAANPIVFTATSEDIRKEYKRIIKPKCN